MSKSGHVKESGLLCQHHRSWEPWWKKSENPWFYNPDVLLDQGCGGGVYNPSDMYLSV